MFGKMGGGFVGSRRYEASRAGINFAGARAGGLFAKALLEQIARHHRFTPVQWKTAGGVRKAFSLPEALETLTKHKVLGVHRQSSAEYYVVLIRDQPVSYHASVTLQTWFTLQLDLTAPDATDDWSDLYVISDCLARCSDLDFGYCHATPRIPVIWRGEDDRDDALMAGAAFAKGIFYDVEGPRGLAHRTYFGRHLITLLGRERVDSVPAPATVTYLRDDLVRIDVCESPWQAPRELRLAGWRAAMAHLAPAEIFATPSLQGIRGTDRFFDWTTGRRYRRPPTSH